MACRLSEEARSLAINDEIERQLRRDKRDAACRELVAAARYALAVPRPPRPSPPDSAFLPTTPVLALQAPAPGRGSLPLPSRARSATTRTPKARADGRHAQRGRGCSL